MHTETNTTPTGAASTRTGAHALVAALESRGVRHLFGVPGHGAYPIYNALIDFPAIAPVVGRNEQGIGFAAEAYAWVTGRTAVLTSVPYAGVSNSLTSLLEADLSQSRVLYVIEANPAHEDLLRPVATYHTRVDDANRIGAAVGGLFDNLEHGRPGVAVLEVTAEALGTTPSDGVTVDSTGESRASAAGDADALANAAVLLQNARRVAICVGASGISGRAASTIRSLAEKLSAPVFSDPFSKGVVPEDHELAVGNSWTLNGPAEELLADADIVVVVGTPVTAEINTRAWDGRIASGGRGADKQAQQIMLIDWDDRYQGDIPARVRLRGNVPAILSALDAGVTGGDSRGFDNARLKAIRDVAWVDLERRCPGTEPMFRAISEAIPSDAVVVSDSMMGVWLERLYPSPAPQTMRWPFGTGTLGWAVPAAVGVKVADPSREVIAFAGDGAFLYNPQELATMKLYGQKITVVVANDSSYNAIRYSMLETFGRKSSVHELANPDFARFGESFGMNAVTLKSADELRPALSAAIAGETSTLIDLPLALEAPVLLFD